MKEHPIIFNAEMVRAILEGRKTQTRRVVPNWQLPKIQPDNTDGPRYNWMATAQRHSRWGYSVFGETENECAKELNACGPCPYGNSFSALWVREAFRVMGCATDVARLMYRASERNSFTESTRTVPVSVCTKAPSEKWTPSIHMPRWASRIDLFVTKTRVERLNDISEDDAIAEGVRPTKQWIALDGMVSAPGIPATLKFEWLWRELYGEDSWQANPWVWVIEFERIETQGVQP